MIILPYTYRHLWKVFTPTFILSKHYFSLLAHLIRKQQHSQPAYSRHLISDPLLLYSTLWWLRRIGNV